MPALVLLTLLMLTACGGGPGRASLDPAAAQPAAFTLPLANGDLASAHGQASETCRAQGRTARLLARHRDRADFKCM